MTPAFHTFATFLQLLRRDTYVTLKRMHIFGINFGFIYPFMYALCFLYIEPQVLFAENMTQNGSITFAGQISLFALIISFNATVTLLFDLVGDRFIDYQRTIIDSRLVLIERIVFAGLLSFCFLMPFFPIAKLLFPHAFIIPNVSWLSLAWIILLTGFMTSAYHLMIACILRDPHQISRVWMRCNEAMLVFGGIIVPWHIIYTTSAFLGYLALANPLLYVTEGARQALLGGSQFFPLWISSIMLVTWTAICTMIACRVFKKRVDHI